MTNRISGIYCITCIPTGDQYVGSSKDIIARWDKHIKTLRLHKHSNGPLQILWVTYPGMFRLDVLERIELIEPLEFKRDWRMRKKKRWAYLQMEPKEAYWAATLEATLTPTRKNSGRFSLANAGACIRQNKYHRLPERYVILYERFIASPYSKRLRRSKSS